MRKYLILFAAIMIVAGITNRGLAQTAVSDVKSNDANAQILGAIALTAEQDLEFGGIVPDGVAVGTVIIDNQDGRNKTGNLTLVSSKVTPKSGYYTVTGTGLVPYVITVPTNSFNISNTTGLGNETMAVTGITCSKGALTAGAIGSTFTSGGTDNFKIGGTLHVGINQAPGLYTGTFNVTVAY